MESEILNQITEKKLMGEITLVISENTRKEKKDRRMGGWGDREKRDGVNNQIPSTNHQIITNPSMAEMLAKDI